jgi:hypothetical protein
VAISEDRFDDEGMVCGLVGDDVAGLSDLIGRTRDGWKGRFKGFVIILCCNDAICISCIRYVRR